MESSISSIISSSSDVRIAALLSGVVAQHMATRSVFLVQVPGFVVKLEEMSGSFVWSRKFRQHKLEAINSNDGIFFMCESCDQQIFYMKTIWISKISMIFGWFKLQCLTLSDLHIICCKPLSGLTVLHCFAFGGIPQYIFETQKCWRGWLRWWNSYGINIPYSLEDNLEGSLAWIVRSWIILCLVEWGSKHLDGGIAVARAPHWFKQTGHWS